MVSVGKDDSKKTFITEHEESRATVNPGTIIEEAKEEPINFWSALIDTGERKLVYFAPFLLSLVAIALSVYALVDFAAFVTDYRQLEEDVEAQSRQDFDLLTETTLELFSLLLEVGVGLCGDNTANLSTFQRSLDLVQQLASRLKRDTMAVLPSGPIWSDYFIKRFPAQDGYDYGHFANPSRISALFLYGVPNMEPLFRTFAASLFLILSASCWSLCPLYSTKFASPPKTLFGPKRSCSDSTSSSWPFPLPY